MSNIGEKIVVGSPWLSEHIPCFSQSRNFRPKALDGLPEPYAGLMENVVVVVEEKASRAVLADLDIDDEERNSLVSTTGSHAMTNPSFKWAENMPSRISIYRKPILRICRTKQEVVQEVRDTVVHEIGHHFGLY